MVMPVAEAVFSGNGIEFIISMNAVSYTNTIPKLPVGIMIKPA